MKMINFSSGTAPAHLKTRTRFVIFCLLAGLGAAGFAGARSRFADKGLVVHEWGTFTSVQGGDGVLVDWRPLETSKLPNFVYDWKHPGLNRQSAGSLVLGKGGMYTLQRMETPVIYFYSDERKTVDVSVKFPKGFITEWYPQAEQIGPATTLVNPPLATLDGYAHKVGFKQDFSFSSLLQHATTRESRARWSRVEVLPRSQDAQLASLLPLDRSGSHYFSARDTEANYLQINSRNSTNAAPELEKFIFYRGAGNFGTPLRVTETADAVTLFNDGNVPLDHLFLLNLQNHSGQFIQLDRLAPGDHRTLKLESTTPGLPVEKLSKLLGAQMADALVQQGLYRREASAMVNTWKDSWFEEDGLRVLYILPRVWTDATLPLTLAPPPGELVRVMVGRAEVITPELERKLSAALVKANLGEPQARELAALELKKLGRFAEPALRLATRNFSSEANQAAWALFNKTMRPKTESAAL